MVFRYPGGKKKLKKEIIDVLSRSIQPDIEYREVFFGGGAIGMELIKKLHPGTWVWINDIDPGVASIWTAVIHYPNALKDKIESFVPSLEEFYQLKNYLLSTAAPDPKEPADIVEYAFKKLAIHQMSYSGFGTKGGPLGGNDQDSKYLIGCRWNAKNIVKKIDNAYKLLDRVNLVEDRCTMHDFTKVIAHSKKSLIYLDPPYFAKGPECYQYCFLEKDHLQLADLLKNTHHKWVLSYDNHIKIREMYSWANIKEMKVKYTASKANQSHREEVVELLITRG